MSELHEDMPNGQTTAPSAKRRKVARSSIEGHIATIRFEEAGVTKSYDVHRIAGAEKLNGMAASLMAYGVVAVLQAAYAGKDEPVAAADEQWTMILSGKWSPGPSYHDAEPDALALAVCEYRNGKGLKFQGAELTPDTFDDFVDMYKERTGIKSIAAAKRALGMHSEVAAIRTRILSERAKALGKAAKATADASPLDEVF